VRLKCGKRRLINFSTSERGKALISRPRLQLIRLYAKVRQKQSDPAEGGIPAGSLEVTWEV